MNRGVHASALTGGVATAVAAGILAANLLWPSTPTPGAAADVTTFTTPQTVTSSTAVAAPIVRDSYTVTAAPAPATSSTATLTTTATAPASSASPSVTAAPAPDGLACTAGEEAIASGDGWTCGPADLADPTVVAAPEPTQPSSTPGTGTTPAPTPAPVDTRPHGAGVPTGLSLRTVYGDQIITTPGTVLDGLDIHGRVVVKAPNVTIKNSIIRGLDTGSKWGLIDALAGHPGLVVQDTEIVATVPNYYVNGIMGFNFELRRVNIHGVVDQVHLTGGNVVVDRSWLHGNLHFEDDPGHPDGTHDDNIQIQKGMNIVVTNNVLAGSHTASIIITQGQGDVGDVRIQGNKFDNGGCSINISEGKYGPLSGVSILDNLFGRTTQFRNCAMVVFSPGTKLNLSGNAYTDGIVPTPIYR
ncbi:hypothetical protein [Naasia sp. SYSU D00948]|uniref:hypothetical protein n=1 Tax=Naasia sp. SYSU D00948 TaxID=2817379 RepID=UPI001B312B2A|nr:hypothetical protein [Naasia sp. SYSU D00948]